MEKLIEKWRKEAKEAKRLAIDELCDVKQSHLMSKSVILKECADELENANPTEQAVQADAKPEDHWCLGCNRPILKCECDYV